MRLALFLLCATLRAQSFYAAGISGLPQSAPHVSGWALTATELTSKSMGIWSASGIDFNVAQGKVQTTAWTGLATPLRTVGPFTVYALGGVGGASTGTNSGYSLTGGAIVFWPHKTTKWYEYIRPCLAGYSVQKTSVGGQANYAKIGWGF